MSDENKRKLDSLFRNYSDRVRSEEAAAKDQADKAEQQARACQHRLFEIVPPVLKELIPEIAKDGHKAAIDARPDIPGPSRVELSFTTRPRAPGPGISRTSTTSTLDFQCGGGAITTSLRVYGVTGYSFSGGGSTVPLEELSREWVEDQVVRFVNDVLEVN